MKDNKQIIAISSFKGGTAKTSTALHLGAALALFHKKRVLLIDFDAQANLTTGLGFDPDEYDSMAPVLQGSKTMQEVILNSGIENLDLVPADTYLERVEVTDNLASDRYSHERLRDIVADTDYDFIIIDTPPSLCWLTESALIAANHTLICATPEFYSIKGLERLSQFIQSIGQRHPLNILGVVLSFWNARGKSNHAFLEVIQTVFPDKAFDVKIRRDISVSEASIYGKPVFLSTPSARAVGDYKDLTEQVLTRIESFATSTI
ncbi:MAG: ParA family protein [Chlamydiales bacterium]|nr:ParA family protein [Chlamydiia bacterium]MCP5507428.1 ParA family protein [Chlamydiales bacterium]